MSQTEMLRFVRNGSGETRHSEHCQRSYRDTLTCINKSSRRKNMPKLTVKTPWASHLGSVPLHLNYFEGSMFEAVEAIAQ